MRTVTVRRDIVTVRTVLHGVVSVSPSIIATAVTQWLEALWHTESPGVVCNNIWSASPNPLVFQHVSGPHIIFRPTQLLSAFEKRCELVLCALTFSNTFFTVKLWESLWDCSRSTENQSSVILN